MIFAFTSLKNINFHLYRIEMSIYVNIEYFKIGICSDLFFNYLLERIPTFELLQDSVSTNAIKT